MEPQIQYVTTSDGVNIAFTTYGEGPALIWSQQPVTSHVQREWEQPLRRAAISAFAATGMFIRFDPRGVGLSDRDVDDFSIEARVRDLEAVVEHLHLMQFSLLGLEEGGLPAIAYAAKHPERVSHLVLLNCFARGGKNQLGRGLPQLIDADWEMYTESVGAQELGYDFEGSHQYAEFVRECITQEVLARMIEADEQIDLSSLLSEIQAPTLVVRHSGLKWLPMDETRRLAAGIPNARLYEVEGFLQDNIAQLGTTILEFLGVEVGSAAEEPRLDAGAVHTILFTDMEGSTGLTQRLGDAAAQEILRTHNSIVRDALTAHSGTEIKHTGDGIMASFTSASASLEAGVAIQKALADHNQAHPDAAIRVRIGLNAGEPVAEDEDLFGTAVQLAARVCDKAEPGQILASNVVQELAAGKGFIFADQGEASLKGFEKPVRLHEVRWHD